MSESLKDQLKALGLVRDQPPARGKGKPRRRAPPATTSRADEIDLDEAWRRRQQSERQEQEQARKHKLEEEQRRRRINTEIEAIVKDGARNDPGAELKRHFLYKGRIRSVLVTAEQLEALNAGRLGLAFLKGRYYVLEPEQVARVQAISADHVPDLQGADDDEDEHPVPDDLVW